MSKMSLNNYVFTALPRENYEFDSRLEIANTYGAEYGNLHNSHIALSVQKSSHQGNSLAFQNMILWL